MISRARPLLGTLVCIRADAAGAVVDDAFAAIARVHALMSVQDEESELARINREAHVKAVRVHPWTFEVLALAQRFARATAGAFDATLGHRGATYRDVLLGPGRRVALRRPARLDLGGIAKGFAVDRAVSVLRRHGATRGCVNAGGDLRLFGNAPQPVEVRLPSAPEQCVRIESTRYGAYATSAGYYQAEVLDPRTQRRLCADSSVTVTAASCAVADALTKAVAALGPVPGVLARFGASAYLLDKRGVLHAARS